MRTYFGVLPCPQPALQSRVKNDSQKAQKRLCRWVFLWPSCGALYYWSDLQTTSLRVLWNSRAWRKMSWRYAFSRWLYPCLGERLECPLRFVRFPSCLKLSVASIWVARNGYVKGGHPVYFKFAPLHWFHNTSTTVNRLLVYCRWKCMYNDYNPHGDTCTQ